MVINEELNLNYAQIFAISKTFLKD